MIVKSKRMPIIKCFSTFCLWVEICINALWALPVIGVSLVMSRFSCFIFLLSLTVSSIFLPHYFPHKVFYMLSIISIVAFWKCNYRGCQITSSPPRGLTCPRNSPETTGGGLNPKANPQFLDPLRGFTCPITTP